MNYQAFETLLDMVERQAEIRGDAVAFEAAGDLKLSYRDLAERVRGLALSLAVKGAGRNARVAIVLPNGLDIALALLGVSAAAIAAPLNPAFRADEFRTYFRQIGVQYLIVLKGRMSVAREVAAEIGVRVLELQGGGEAVLSDVAGFDPAGFGSVAFVPPGPSDIAAILMTSGSTGRPKPAKLSHRNVCVGARDISQSLALSEQDRLLVMSGQFLIGGMTTLLPAPIHAGSSAIYTDGFDAAEFFRLAVLKSPSWVRLAPAMLHEVLAYSASNPGKTLGTSLRLIRSGGAPVRVQLADEIENRFGVPVIQSYGMTEASTQITAAPLPPAARKPGSCGLATGAEVAVVGPDGDVLPAGQIGEVVTRGENVFIGYDNDPQGTAEVLRDGWLHTGDLGCLDEDGHLFLKGRLRQMINRGGEKVNPQEVDEVLLEHPAVAQAASFTVEHRTLGEDVAAAVCLEPSACVTEQELRRFVAKRLASYKVPRRVIFLSRLPVGSGGKVDRTALSEMAIAMAGPVAQEQIAG